MLNHYCFGEFFLSSIGSRLLPKFVSYREMTFMCYILYQAAGCDQVLRSNVRIDRCSVCGGNGNTCKHVVDKYMKQWNQTGKEYFDM